jgi:hypothetical protein
VKSTAVATGVQNSADRDHEDNAVRNGGYIHRQRLYLGAGEGLTENVGSFDGGYDTAVAIVVGAGDADFTDKHHAQMGGAVALSEDGGTAGVFTDGAPEAVQEGEELGLTDLGKEG